MVCDRVLVAFSCFWPQLVPIASEYFQLIPLHPSPSIPCPFSLAICFPPTATQPMAKTKQTAKKSTDGAAKRKIIQPSARILCPRASRSRGPSCSPQPPANIEMAEGLHPSKPTTGVEPAAGRKEGGGGSEGDNVSITSVSDLNVTHWIPKGSSE